MIVSTSSHNVRLTEDVCEYVESVVRNEFDHLADHIASVDARLEAIHDARDRCVMKAVLSVDLRNHRGVVSEIQDDNLYTAIRRSATASARVIDRQLQHSVQRTGQRLPARFHAFGRFPAPNV